MVALNMVSKMVIQDIGVQQNWKMEYTFLVLDNGCIVIKPAQNMSNPAVIFHSNMVVSITKAALKLTIINFGVQHKWIKLENTMGNGKIVMKIARVVDCNK